MDYFLKKENMNIIEGINSDDSEVVELYVRLYLKENSVNKLLKLKCKYRIWRHVQNHDTLCFIIPEKTISKDNTFFKIEL